jgi:hypothetical protein
MKIMKTWKSCFLTAGVILLGGLAFLPAQAQFSTYLSGLGPLDYWRLNEVTNSTALDMVTNHGTGGAALNGYVVGGLRGQPGGIVGNCLELANIGEDVGNCSNRVDIPNLYNLTKVPWTVEFWANPNPGWGPSDGTGLSPVSSDSPFGTDQYEGNRSGFLFYVNSDSWSLRIGGQESYAGESTAAVPVNPGSWTHVVGTFDGTNLNLYINGVLGATSQVGASTPYFPNVWVPTRVGGTALAGAEFQDGLAGGITGEGNRGWDGGIDELAMYSSILSSNVISNHYATAISNPSAYDALILASSPVGYWNFDEPAFTAPNTNTDFTLGFDIGSLDILGTNAWGAQANQPGVPGLSADAKSVYYNESVGSLVLESNAAPYEFNDPSADVYPNPISLAAWIKPNLFNYMGNIIAQGFDPSPLGDDTACVFAENFLRVGDTFDWEAYSDDYSGGDISDYGISQALGPPVMLPGNVYYSVGAYEGSEGPDNDGSYYTDAFFPAPPGDAGNWVFLVGTYDPSTFTWNLYRNGVLVAQQSDYFEEGPVYVNMPWAVGSRSDADPFVGFRFDGNIEEAAIFNTTLSATVVSNLYQSVHQPPVITQAPVAPEPSFLGGSASFNVWADGPGTLTYQWYSNSVALAGDTGTNIIVSPLTAAADGTYSVIVSNAYGSITSSASLFVTPSLPPVALTPQTRWVGFPATFQPVSLPNLALSFSWYTNGGLVPGVTTSNLTVTASAATAVNYQIVISNSFGTSTSAPVALSILTPPAGYAATVLADHPIAFYQMGETSGTIGYDYAGGNNGNYYDVLLGQPGFSPVNTNDAVGFQGVANSYLGDIGATSINFAGFQPFTIEAWAQGGGGQIDGAAILVKGAGNNGTTESEQFCFDLTQDSYRFFVIDSKNAELFEDDSSATADGDWHYLVGVFTGETDELNFYVDGKLTATSPVAGPPNGTPTSTAAISIGSEKSGPTPVYDWAFNGNIDMVAIYNYALTEAQVTNHYTAAYGTTLYPQIVNQPVSVTNYVGFPVQSNSIYSSLIIPPTFTVDAIGSYPLTYTWYKAGEAGPLVTGTSDYTISGDTISIGPLVPTNAGTYTVVVSNNLGAVTSAPVTLTVVSPPATPPSIPGLVMHLKFDGNLLDSTGRGNNGTNMAYGAFTVQTNNYEAGVLGQSFYFITQTNGFGNPNGPYTNSTYATLGNRPDLQFGSGSFSVALWIQLPYGYDGNDLPYFCDVVGSTFGEPGFCFESTYGAGTEFIYPWPGAWGCSVFDSSGSGLGLYGFPYGSLDDGNWHHLVYIVNTAVGGGLDVYLDGSLTASRREGGSTVVGIGSINTTNVACIGQDPTGHYGQSSQNSPTAIDELCVFDRALTPFEAETIYAANAFSELSIVGAPLTNSFTVQNGTNLIANWNEGYLQSSTNLTGPWTTLYLTPPVTLSPTNPATFYRVKF